MSRTPLSGFSSRAIHHGYDPAENQGALTPPMHLASTFAFESAEQGGAIFAGEEPGYFYSRIGNPTVDLLEQRLAVLEGAEAGVAAASGMGAITAVMWSLLEAGDEIVTDKTLYGCTFAFFRHGLAKFGVKVTHVDLTDPEVLEAAMHGGVKVVYFETPANPNMRLVDIAAISEVAHRHDAQVVVDNTYATPALTRPIELGADIVVHSMTKFLGGHGNSMGGVIVDGGGFDWSKDGKYPTLSEPCESYHGMKLHETFGNIAFAIACRVLGLRDLGPAISPFNA